MIKTIISLFGSKIFSGIGFFTLIAAIFLNQHKIADLEKENQNLQFECDRYKLLCSDYEKKIKAQTELVRNTLEREKKAIEQETERKTILSGLKTEHRTNNTEIVDYETHKKVIYRLNRPL